ncbi:hypothetical protein ACVINH_002298 [Rhizobium anhuiense]|jgi:hypothetical protein
MSRMAHMRWEMSKFGANLPEIGAIFPQISRTHSILTMFFSKRQHS